jgi:hypothetical protein
MMSSRASSKQRALDAVRHTAAFVVLGIGVVGYVLAGGAVVYFAFVTLSHAVGAPP